MGYSYVLLGDLRFDSADKRKRWHDAVLTSTVGEAPHDFAYVANGATVASVIAPLRSPEIGTFDETDTTLNILTIIDKADDAATALPQAFREAAAFGGRGELTLVGYIDAPAIGARVRVKPKSSTFVTLDEDVVEALQKCDLYRSLDAGLDALVDADIARVQQGFGKSEAQSAAIIRNAPDMKTVLAKLRSALPEHATFLEKSMIPESSVVKALVARKDADAVPRMRARLHELGFGTNDGEWLQIVALSAALYELGEAHDEIHTLWLDAPSFFVQDHERLRELGRRDIDKQLASRLGTSYGESENHRWIVEAFFATAGRDAPARAAALLEGNIRKRPGAVESLRWVVGTLESPEYKTPVWEAFLRRVIAEQPWSTSRSSDVYDQIRANAMAVLADWKVPGTAALVIEHADRIGEVEAVRILTALGDPAAIPWLERGLAASKRKDQRAAFTHAIMKCGGTRPAGAPPAAPAVGEHVIDVSPSGRASCKGCKEKIAKGELRFGEAAKNAFSDGGEASMRWFHLRCAAEKKPKIFGPTLAAYKGDVPDRAALEAIVSGATKPKATKRPKS